MRQIEDIYLHKWDTEFAEEGVKIKPDNLDAGQIVGSKIYRDFRDKSEKEIGEIYEVDLDNEGLKVTLRIEASELEGRPLTLAPEFTGEIVEREDGEAKFIKEARVECIGLFNSEHEAKELTNNLGDILDD